MERTRITIILPDDILAKYHAVADKHEKTVEQIIETQLWRYTDVESKKPITLSDTHRQHLESLLARNFTTADELVFAIQRSLSVHMGGVDVSLTPYLLDRLKTRCQGMEWEKFVPFIMKRLVEEYVGVR